MRRHTLRFALMLMVAPLAVVAAQDPTASLRGTVTDSIRHGPLVGATVVAFQTAAGAATDSHDYTATTDAHGKYAINALPPGTYVLTVEHPWLDSTGLGIPSKRADLVREHSATVNLAVPSGSTIRSAYCPIAASDSSIGLVAGYVKDVHTDHPVTGARVVFAWSDFDVDRPTARATTRERTAAVNTGRDGTFRICGLPVQRPILMQAQYGDNDATGAVEVQVPVSGVLVETLRLDASTVGAASIAGIVQREGSQRAIAGAHVRLFGAAGEVLSNPDGSFRLSDVPLGTQSIEVTAVGYYPRRYALDVHATGMGHATIEMLQVASVLDSIRIIAKRSNAPLGAREFDSRSAHGHGVYISEEMIAKADPFETTDLFRQASGLYVMGGAVYSSRGITTLSGNRVCSPAIYINGGPGGSVNDIAPNAIYGIEVYASSANAPVMYKSSSCGMILIWTK